MSQGKPQERTYANWDKAPVCVRQGVPPEPPKNNSKSLGVFFQWLYITVQ